MNDNERAVIAWLMRLLEEQNGTVDELIKQAIPNEEERERAKLQVWEKLGDML